MANNDTSREIGQRLKEVVAGQLRTMGMFMKKIDTRIDGAFKIQTPMGEENRKVFYTLQTKTVPLTQAPENPQVNVEEHEEKRKEKSVLGQLIRDYEYKQRLREEEYEDLPPEFNPEEERKSKEEMIEFLNGRTDGLLEAYEQVTGRMFSEKLDKPKYSDMNTAMAGEKQTLTQARNRYEELEKELQE